AKIGIAYFLNMLSSNLCFNLHNYDSNKYRVSFPILAENELGPLALYYFFDKIITFYFFLKIIFLYGKNYFYNSF
ncbi:hypothetical protein ACJX0J_039774, partial [Zea mays]